MAYMSVFSTLVYVVFFGIGPGNCENYVNHFG